jgi:hypothetical protein
MYVRESIGIHALVHLGPQVAYEEREEKKPKPD